MGGSSNTTNTRREGQQEGPSAEGQWVVALFPLQFSTKVFLTHLCPGTQQQIKGQERMTEHRGLMAADYMFACLLGSGFLHDQYLVFRQKGGRMLGRMLT